MLRSDNHGDSRSLATARDWLLEVGDAEQAELLTRTQRRDACSRDEPLFPVPPLPLRAGHVRPPARAVPARR